jgi:basic membrane protein A and related proteins
MHSKQRLVLIAVVLCLSVLAFACLALVGCGGSTTTTAAPATTASTAAATTTTAAPSSTTASSTATTAGAAPMKIALIMPGKKDDVSFNQAAYASMKRLEDGALKGQIQVSYVEGLYDVSQFEPTARDFANQGYELIIAHGFQYQEPMVQMAPQFPNTYWALASGYKFTDNSCAYDVTLQEGGYAMGVLAASLSKTGKVGVVGGVDVAEIHRGHEGFKLGAKSVNPNIQIQEVFTGDWTDAAKAKEAATSMYTSGVDAIWHSGDGIGIGVVEAAKEQNQLVMANEVDESVLAPDNVVTSVVYNWDAAFTQMINDVKNKTTKPNNVYMITFANGGITLAPYGNLDSKVPQAVKDKMDATVQALKDGKIDFSSIKDK